MFDFSDENKKRYYDKAEEYLKENGLECFEIDRSKIRVKSKEEEVHVFVIPFSKRQVTGEELRKAKQLKRFVSINDRFTKPKRGVAEPIRENAYIKFEIIDNDKNEKEGV